MVVRALFAEKPALILDLCTAKDEQGREAFRIAKGEVKSILCDHLLELIMSEREALLEARKKCLFCSAASI